MSTITICEREKTENGFKASLSFEGGTEYEIEVSNPFTAQEEARLEWYFEQWLVFPHLETVKAQAAKDSVRQYGEKLFEQVFKSDVDAYSDYKEIKAQIKQIEIAGNSAEFQALHWEALQDPQQPRPLAVDCVMVRKRGQNPAGKAVVEPSPVINLLVVTARPGEENDVNHRTISRPLMAAIQKSKLRVQVDLLRPATFEALTKHLEEKGAGFYHIVHLDMHGAVMSYGEVKELQEKEQKSNPGHPLSFRAFGRELEEFAGYKALLSFESGIPGQTDLREASELADLLTGKNIPVCILNACQSAKQVQGDERETSLGAALMAAGMQAVLAMSYSITVSAAEILMTTLYQQLFAQKSLDEAMRLGRKELFNRKERKACFNQKIRLEDWLLPVVYRREPVDFRLCPFTPEEEKAYWQQPEHSYRFETLTYSFVGRDLEILKIERALLRRNILLVQGMGGTGKTTLLNYLREWWQTTRFVKEVFYFGYDKKAYTLEQIVSAIGQRVYGQYEAAQFQAMELKLRVAKLVATLKSESYALMLDNLESVTGQQLAIQHTLNPEQQQELRDFLGRLVGGETKVVLGSRSREKWLDGVLNGAVYELRGLDKEARTTLAEQILERQVQEPRKIERIRQSDEFKKLMKLLAGYPLAMQVVLGNLKQQSAAEILAGLDAAALNLDSGKQEKTASILKCVEYSHSNLSPEAQKLLVCLAPFSGFLFRPVLPSYGEQLQELVPFQDYPFEQFDGAIAEAIAWGLLSPMDADNPQLLTIQPVFPYFLKTKLNGLDAETREALWEGFKNHYRVLAGDYQQLMNSKEAKERQLGILFCNWEYENLYNALKICLEKQESISVFFCLDKYFELINDIQSNLKLAEFVNQKLATFSSSFLQSEQGYQIAFAVERLATCYLTTQNYDKARKQYETALEIYDRLDFIEEQQKQLYKATNYQQLGRVAQELRQFEQAHDYYQQALQILIDFGDRHSQAHTYHQLGRVAQELRQFEQANDYYQQALQINNDFGDRYNQARTYHQLGAVAQELRQFEQAQDYYQQALQIFIDFGDRYSQASTYHQLGAVAQELRQFEQATDYYQQALQINNDFGDRYSQASTYHQLGIVAEELRQFEQATDYYQQALQILIDFGDRHSQASTYHQLGIVAEELRQFEQATDYYQQALQIFIDFGDRYSQASTYHQLGIVAQQLRQFEQAQDYYQQALQIFIDFGDRYSQASTYHCLGMVAEELGKFEEAKGNYWQALQIWAEFNNEDSLKEVSVPSLVNLYRTTQDESILADLAPLFGITVEELKAAILSD